MRYVQRTIVFLGVCSLLLTPLSRIRAQTSGDAPLSLETLEQRLDDQERVIQGQQRMIDEQRQQLAAIQGTDKQTPHGKRKRHAAKAAQAAATPIPPPVPSQTAPAVPAAQTAQAATAPGPAPAEKARAVSRAIAPDTAAQNLDGDQQERPQVQALADEGGILSPRGMLTYENTIEYTNTTRNLFSFNGVELAQVVLVGAINANSATHQVVQDTSRLRLGINNRLEADVRVPFVYRNDLITNQVSSTGATTRTSEEGHDIGDLDGGLAYQLNHGADGWPFLIGNLRYKANNADGPYDVAYDSSGVARRLPVGTGFQTAEVSVTAIKVTDPAVLFANLGYVYDVSRTIDRTIGNTFIGRVEPSDAINALIGFAFAVNPETSFSIGYKHSYVFATTQHSVDVPSGAAFTTRSDSQQVGALTMGLSYATSPTTSINFNLEAGVTNDAPDVHLLLRVPFQLGKVF